MGAPYLPDQMKAIAFQGSGSDRRALAAAPEAPPELLYFLTGDSDSAVRVAAAANPAMPALADKRLAGDAEPSVRVALGRRLAPQAGELAARGEACGSWQALWALARDVAVEVRAAVADALADLPDAPRDLVLALAEDEALEVCEPVIRLSPALGEVELLRLVAEPPGACTRVAVAGRLHLPDAVSLALARTRDEPAVLALLRNHTARIGPSGLEALLEGARAAVAWQEPFALRPRLPSPVLERLIAMMAEEQLRKLLNRADLPAGLAARVRARLPARLAGLAVRWEGAVTYSSRK